MTGLAECMKTLLCGCRHCAPYTQCSSRLLVTYGVYSASGIESGPLSYGVYSGIGSLMAYTLRGRARSYPQAMCTDRVIINGAHQYCKY